PVVPFESYIALLERRDRSATQAFWREALSGVSEPTLLAPAGARHNEARFCEFRLSAELTQGLKSALRGRGLTLATALEAAWALLLWRLTGRDAVVFGVTVSGRPEALFGVDSAVGMFINTLPLSVAIEVDATVGEWLEKVQSRQASLQAHAMS